MKKTGFTLAEVLITLGIIGVIAALTLPTLSNNAQAQANAAKLSSTVSDLENAFGMLLVDKDEVSLEDIKQGFSADHVGPSLSPYLKTTDEFTSLSSVYDSDNPFKDANGNSYYISVNGTYLKSGAIVLYSEDSTDENKGIIGNIFIDTNGTAPPNRLGKDLFSFYLIDDGSLTPMDDATKTLVRNGYKVK